VVRPSCLWQISANSKDFVAVDPPAPHVTVTKSGRSAEAIRDRRDCRLEKPEEVLGGKNSREKYREEGGREDKSVGSRSSDMAVSES